MIDLIRTLEEAPKGSRELDARIAIAVHSGGIARHLTGTKQNVVDVLSAHEGEIVDVAYYTTSVDAALTLVPEGAWNGQISWNFGELRKGGFVELNCANPAWLVPGYDPSQPPHEHAACVSSYEDSDASNEVAQPRPLALAICIAALRARAAGVTT